MAGVDVTVCEAYLELAGCAGAPSAITSVSLPVVSRMPSIYSLIRSESSEFFCRTMSFVRRSCLTMSRCATPPVFGSICAPFGYFRSPLVHQGIGL